MCFCFLMGGVYIYIDIRINTYVFVDNIYVCEVGCPPAQ